jgi:gliding motility-associated-like protein
LNDFFDLSGFDVDNLKIFNRYGREVYSKDDYEREWYGQDFNGNMLPAATYYYYVKLDDGVEKTGWVYLTRD